MVDMTRMLLRRFPEAEKRTVVVQVQPSCAVVFPYGITSSVMRKPEGSVLTYNGVQGKKCRTGILSSNNTHVVPVLLCFDTPIISSFLLSYHMHTNGVTNGGLLCRPALSFKFISFNSFASQMNSQNFTRM